jgi:hypothetical protein
LSLGRFRPRQVNRVLPALNVGADRGNILPEACETAAKAGRVVLCELTT